MRYLLLPLLALVFSVSHASEAPSLVGKWSFAYNQGGEALMSAVGVTVFRADGTYYSGMVISADHPRANMSVSSAIAGKWQLEGKKLKMVLTATSTPELAPVGTEVSCEILEITDSHYTYRSSDGSVKEEKRIKL